jgi:hypothetical protein
MRCGGRRGGRPCGEPWGCPTLRRAGSGDGQAEGSDCGDLLPHRAQREASLREPEPPLFLRQDVRSRSPGRGVSAGRWTESAGGDPAAAAHSTEAVSDLRGGSKACSAVGHAAWSRVALRGRPQPLLARAAGAAPPVAEAESVECTESSVRMEQAQIERSAPVSCSKRWFCWSMGPSVAN